MLRAAGHCGEIREGNLVSLPNRSKHTQAAWRRPGYVYRVPARASKIICGGGEVKPDIPSLRRRCRSVASAVLVAVSVKPERSRDFTETMRGSLSADRRSRKDHGSLDCETETQGAVWITTPSSLGATGTTARTPVHAARTGTTLPRTRTTTSGLAASVTTKIYRSAEVKARQADRIKQCGQPFCPPSGNTLLGSGFRLVAGATSDQRKPEPAYRMKRHKNLIERITNPENMRVAYYNTSKAKRQTFGYLEFKEFAQININRLRDELIAGDYKIGKYREFTIYEPKPRLISALDFKDRLVQHAVCNVIGPIFERSLLNHTFACRPGLGTHAGVRYVQSELRKPGATHYLKTDYSKFFPSVNREILHGLIERKIGCPLTLKILREIIPSTGLGIPIGSLTSQLFANVYGGQIDQFIHHQLGHRRWARYMDDIVILGTDPVALRDDFYKIQQFSADEMGMRISKWSCSGVGRGINFLGYRIWATHKLLRQDSVLRAKRKVARFIRHDDRAGLDQFLASWSGHAQWADTHNLFTWMEKHHGITCH